MHEYKTYEEAISELTPEQLKLLNEEAVRLREYALVYYITTRTPPRPRYLMLRRSRKLEFISGQNIVRFMYANGFITRHELVMGRQIEVCYPSSDTLTEADIVEGIHTLEMKIIEGDILPSYVKMPKLKGKPGRPKGSPNKRKKVASASR